MSSGVPARAKLDERIRAFLESGPWAVVGASNDRDKYGNKVLRCYVQKSRAPVYPVNPNAEEVEGLACYPSLGALPEPARALIECHMVRIAARPLGVARIDVTHEAVQLQFIKNPPIDGAKVIDFIRKKGRQARLAGPEKLRVEAKLPAWQERASAVKDILQQLAP